MYISSENYSLKASTKKILTNLSFQIEGPGLICITGASGVGKSSFLKAITMLLGDRMWQSTGNLVINGKPINNWNPEDLRRQVMYVPQQSVGWPYKVSDNVVKPQILIHKGRTVAEATYNAVHVLEKVGLMSEITGLDQTIASLSGGQLQRLAIARALALQPQALLFDEPTSALDPQAKDELLNYLQDIGKSKLIIVVTHDIAQTSNFYERAIYLHRNNEGSAYVEADGKPSRIFFEEIGTKAYNFANGIRDNVISA